MPVMVDLKTGAAGGAWAWTTGAMIAIATKSERATNKFLLIITASSWWE
jgi:hypothetical protein